MKYIFYSFCLLFTAALFGQDKFPTYQFNGEAHYVYPYRKTVQSRAMPKEIKNFKSFKAFVLSIYSKEIDKKTTSLGEKEKQQLEMYQQMMFQELDKNKKKYVTLIKISKKYTGPTLFTKFSLKKDIAPALDAIPDGKYVQLYRVNEFQTMRDTNLVAGVFHIKNGMLEGPSRWYYPDGQIALKGSYFNGLKSGSWTYYDMDIRAMPTTKEELKQYQNEVFVSKIDTTIASYQHGSLNGRFLEYQDGYLLESGYYKNGNPVGHWNHFKSETDTLQSNYTILRDSLIKQFKPLIRQTCYFDKYADENDSIKYEPSFNLKKIASLNEPKKWQSLQLKPNKQYDYYDYDLESDLSKSLESAAEEAKQAVMSSAYQYSETPYEEDFDPWSRLDSVGYYVPYDGKIQQFYPNGQLIYELDIKEGRINEPQNIYFDNGKIFNSITFNTDSNYYEKKQFYYNGELEKHAVIDTMGNFIVALKEVEEETVDTLVFEGLPFIIDSYNYDEWNYDAWDTLKTEGLSGSIILDRTLTADTVLSSEAKINFETREYQWLSLNVYSQNGRSEMDTTRVYQAHYDEGYQSKRINATDFLDKGFTLDTKSSCGLKESYEIVDSLPATYLVRQGRFDCTDLYTLKLNGVPFSGSFLMHDNPKHYGDVKKVSKDHFEFSYGIKPRKRDYKVEIKDLKEEIKNTTDQNTLNKLNDDLEWYTDRHGKKDYSKVYTVFKDDLEDFFPDLDVADYTTTKLTGEVLNGKAHGTWNEYDQDGVLIRTLQFNKGEQTGIELKYKILKKTPKLSKEDKKLIKSMPKEFLALYKGTAEERKKDKIYKSYEAYFEDGKQIDVERKYDENGRTISEYHYKNGRKNGLAISANNEYIYATETFMEGYRDGISKVYFKFKDKDSVLIYYMTYQNGQLQGKSEVYHENGELAKKGFFLDNQPIEQYNAYDTLGNLIHYVTFDKGFVQEEKIWEENELSARYQFNWEDSVYFKTFDFVDNEDFIDRYTLRHNLPNNRLSKAYYGRQSMVHDNHENYTLTKYYPTNVIAREGKIEHGDKIGIWNFYNLDAEKMYQVDYRDSVLTINDSTEFKSKGIYIDFKNSKDSISQREIIELNSTYDCANSDHFETRQYYYDPTIKINKEERDSIVLNYYDSGVLQSDGRYTNGVPVGIWKYYDPNGKINKVGEYKNGKRHGRWLMGDLSKTKYLGDICLNPNLPDLEEVIEYKEKDLDISVKYYEMGKVLNSSSYNINLNEEEDLDEE